MGTVATWSWPVSSIIRGTNLYLKWCKVITCWFHRLEDLYERAEERTKQLQVTHELRDEWKQRGDELLYSMIPQSIAEQLRNGVDPVDTCEVNFQFQVPQHISYWSSFIEIQTFDNVTVLFLDITNVEGISAASPFDAVSCMNIVFSCLDNVIDRHSVYKVNI